MIRKGAAEFFEDAVRVGSHSLFRCKSKSSHLTQPIQVTVGGLGVGHDQTRKKSVRRAHRQAGSVWRGGKKHEIECGDWTVPYAEIDDAVLMAIFPPYGALSAGSPSPTMGN
jgi:hypothetical protein